MAIEIYYTGAQIEFGPQPEASNSIGGYISNSMFPNGSLGNLFGDVSYLNRVNKQKIYRLIVLKVVGDVHDIKVGVLNSHQSSYDIKLGFVEPNGQHLFEKLPNPTAIPTYTEMEDKMYMLDDNDIANMFTIGDKNDAYVGIWVERQVKKSDTIENPCEHFEEVELLEDDLNGFNLIISFTPLIP